MSGAIYDRKPTREPRYPCLAQLTTRGNHYDVGYNVGLSFCQRIALFYQESDVVQHKLIPFYDTQAGRDYFELALKVNEQCYPQYVRELRGLADGAGLPFEHVFMTNVAKEVYNVLFDELKSEEGSSAYYRRAEDPEDEPFQENYGCSGILINKPDEKVILHNEDSDAMVKPYGYLLSADIEEDGVEEKFHAYCYPGFLPGCCYGTNMHGVTQSINFLVQDKIYTECPSRVFVLRALLAAKDINDAVRILENEPYGVGYGFAANMSTKDHDIVSIEVAGGPNKADVHVYRLKEQKDPDRPCHYYHFNMYKHLKVSEIEGLESSIRRTRRVQHLPPPRTTRDALNILGDTYDQKGPIYRTPRPTDFGMTVGTVVFDVIGRKMHLYQNNTSVEANKSFLTLPFFV